MPAEPRTKATCRDLRVGGSDNDWQDRPCGDPATTTFDGRPVCQWHREAAERRELETIAEAFFDGVPLKDIRIVADAGGLKGLRSVLLRLIYVADVALPCLARDPKLTDEAFRECTESRTDALAFLYSGK